MMRVETPKTREWSEALQDKAVEFHGHGGPFMIIGLRMGLIALRRLDAHGWFDLQCRVRLRWRPPDSCVLDGIQISTGCTTGKHNLEVEEGDGISAHFTKENEKVSIVLRQEVLKEVHETLAAEGEESVKALMNSLKETSENDIFKVYHMTN